MERKMLQDMVLAAASLHSARIAVTYDSGSSAGPVSLSYNDIVALGNDLTHHLQKQCMHIHVIALYCHTDVHMPIWILSILQLPAAYVPLNPEAPAQLSARVMARCGLEFCVLQSDLLQKFKRSFSNLMLIEVRAVWSKHNLTLVRVQQSLTTDQVQDEVTEAKAVTNTALREEANVDFSALAAVPKNVNKGALAYILHTSGTTGLPKIVRVPHKCIVPNILHLRSVYKMTADDVVFLASPLTFDPSVVEIFLALSSGARLLIVPTVVKRMPNRLAHVLFTTHRTTVLQVTPTLLGRFGRRALQEEVLSAGSSLRVLALGGEACPSLAVLRSWRQEGNHTHVYNIYGITEVSCWACCYEFPENLLQSTSLPEASVPLGAPLMGTTVEVRDEHGCVITEGEGQVFIGGKDRVCLLDDEVTVLPGTMRGTGDWVQVKDTHLYYLGRRDRLAKRHGQRVHLDNVQQVLMSLPQVEACAVDLYKGSRLVAFVVAATPPGGPKASASPTSSSVEQQADGGSSLPPSGDRGDLATRSPYPAHRDHEEMVSATRGLQRAVLQRLSQLLPSHSVPDTLVLVPALPLSSHGKVSMGELLKIYRRQRAMAESRGPLGNVETLGERLKALWRETLGLAKDAAVEEDSNFLFGGGDSLQALRLCNDITNTVGGGTSSSGLLEVLLDGSFSDVLRHVSMETLTHPMTSSSSSSSSQPVVKKRRADDPFSSARPKRQLTDPHSTTAPERLLGNEVPSVKTAVRYTVLRRAGEVVEMSHSDSLKITDENSHSDTAEGPIIRTESTPTQQATVANGSTESSHSCTVGANELCVSGGGEASAVRLGLRVSWTSDTGKCVDASPVLLVQRGPEGASSGSCPARTTVFIGSHSHRMQALDLATGGLLWERVLGDRIESSAAVSRCGALVVVGCYDGSVYSLCVRSGEKRWVFETGDAVKSCPTVDPLTGLVVVGSHDGHVYALDPQTGQCVWKRHCGGGAVFSSPRLHPSLRQLFVATLGGNLLCLNPDSGSVLWTCSRETPFFSSPCCSSSHVLIGSTDGNICCFSLTGEMLWKFATGGPVFSSPCLTLDGRRVVCGSHDGCAYCLDCGDGSLVWRFQTSGRVYSSPCVFDGPPWQGRRGGPLVGLASTDGTLWVVDGEDGTLRASLPLPGELFSSPVVWERSLVMGCRNDFVYCVELTNGEKEEKEEDRGNS